MSDNRTGELEWPQDESMETVSSTEGAGQEGPCANPAQPGMQALTSVEDLRGRQYAYVQARHLGYRRTDGNKHPHWSPDVGEAMEMIRVPTSPSLNFRGSSRAPVVDTLAPVGTDRQETGRGEESVSLSLSEQCCGRDDPGHATSE